MKLAASMMLTLRNTAGHVWDIPSLSQRQGLDGRPRDRRDLAITWLFALSTATAAGDDLDRRLHALGPAVATARRLLTASPAWTMER